MKQTSLIQSWTRSLNTFSKSVCQPTSKSDVIPVSAPIDDSDDQLLASVFDSYRQRTEEPTTSQDTETLITKLRSRLPINYRPTDNDSDRLLGFDEDAGRTWVYPLSANLREYQFHIAEQCLYKNTLVCLPTGLGKTFIAAVVIYNFLRWYPTGRVVFMAPTRPLVTQQLTACLEFGALSPHTTTELTGSTAQAKRRHLWSTQRAIFLTPQVLDNDLQAGICPASELRLLIFDEAHKATGNHSYCQVLRQLTAPPYVHRQFRVIALSATPAADVNGVQTVIANLLIAHLELRVESSPDVKRYTQDRHLETIVVPLGSELSGFRDQLVESVRVPLERLCLRGAIRTGMGDLRPDHVAKYTIVRARADWSSTSAALSPKDNGAIQADFGVVICLLHAIELLDQHGLRPLYQYLSGVLSGQRASGSVRFELSRLSGVDRLMSDLTARFQNSDCPSNSPLNFSTQIPFRSGHPKLDKLKQLLLQHFNSHPTGGETRVIVFSQFRDSVDEIMHMLKQLRPLIRPASFIGQSTHVNKSPVLMGSALEKTSGSPQTTAVPITSGGISQRDQMRVMNAFRTGVYNTLVSTCVGEEGLDVGNVDLIVCFDAFKSPIRLMQRLGRTGRRRLGRIVMLLTEGREERNHAVSMSRTSSIYKALLEGGAYKKLAFYPYNPRMVPLGINPEVCFSKFESLQPPEFIAPHQRKKLFKIPKDLDDANQKLSLSRADAQHLHIQFRTVGPSKLVTLAQACDGSISLSVDRPCVTELHDLTSTSRLKVACDCLQARLTEANPKGPSTSSLHLVSVLRLAEMHKCGVTQLSYHALGLRSVNTNVPMRNLLGETDEAQASQTVRNEHITEPYFNGTGQFLPNSMAPVLLKFPKMSNGIVTCESFFRIDPDPVDPDVLEFLNQLLSQLDSKRDKIRFEHLNEAWNNEIKPYIKLEEKRPKTSPSKVLFNRTDKNVLEKSSAESVMAHEVQSYTPSKVDLVNQVSSITGHSTPAGHSFPCSLAAAFCIGSPAHSVFVPDAENNQSRKCTPAYVASSTQISLNGALALLDRSSVRLDVSSLLDEPIEDVSKDSSLPLPSTSSTLLKSAIFSGLHYSVEKKRTDEELAFEKKLMLSTDFDDDLLASTQNIPDVCLINAPKSSVLHSSPCISPRTNESFAFPSDISWSPISVDAAEQNAKSPCFDSTSSPLEKSYSLLRSDGRTHLDDRTKNTRRSPKVLRASANLRAHHFFLTQAESTQDDMENNSENVDTYESSFIDDNNGASFDSVSTPARGPGKDDSSMLGVYLQSIRSPPLKLTKHGSVVDECIAVAANSGKRSSVRLKFANSRRIAKQNDFIFSQVPEQDDDYERDSFCVGNSEQSDTEDSSILKKRPRRRHIQIDSD